MKTEPRDPHTLTPHPRNSRLHSNEQITALGRAMVEFGFHQPVVIDEGGTILVGHARTLAAIDIGLKQIPCVIASNFSEAQKRALVIADNRLHEFGAGWDEDILTDELRALMAQGIDVSLTGFDVPEPIVKPRADEDAVPPPPDQPTCRLGDVWEMNGHRLVVGDSRDPAVITLACGGQGSSRERDVPFIGLDKTPNLMVTDPPYGVDYDPQWRVDAIPDGTKRATGRAMNDHIADWREVWALFPGDVAYVWHSDLYASTCDESLRAAGFLPLTQIIWAKPRFAIGQGNYHWQHEPCLYAVRGKRKGKSKIDWQGGVQSTVWNVGHRRLAYGHGSQKPVEVMRRPILNHTRPGDVVLDPFLGTGTTIIAAQTCARRCVGVELNPRYADVIVTRYQSFTGQGATLASTGLSFADVAEQRLVAP